MTLSLRIIGLLNGSLISINTVASLEGRSSVLSYYTVDFASKRIKAYFDVIAKSFPQDWEKGNKGVFSKLLSIIINGRSYQHDKFLETRLKDGDQIVFIYY